ncbi:hypothetical protein VNI00_017128 [Paramarasmius palmivorus]|uniref:Uncharacterized protein n=1 Tax=Paramarasmius palmivorus TaxID=297713 RepID=A0AAW0B6Y4_9AGAR
MRHLVLHLLPKHQQPPSIQCTYVHTQPNNHRLFRIYDTKLPSHCPDIDIKDADVVDTPMVDTGEERPSCSKHLASAMGLMEKKEPVKPYWHPFSSAASYELIDWSAQKKTITNDSLNDLAKCLSNPDFHSQDLAGFDAATEKKCLDRHIAEQAVAQKTLLWSASDVWQKGKISIPMPCPHQTTTSEEEAPKFEMEFWIKHSPVSMASHIPQIELSTSNELRWKGWMMKKLRPSYCDATHLTNFGSAQLWPIYVWIANYSKYPQAQPMNFSALHLAYLPKFPDLVKNKYQEVFGIIPSEEIMQFLNREVIQAGYAMILKSEVVKAYRDGKVFKCADARLCKFLFEFFAYSANYVEK